MRRSLIHALGFLLAVAFPVAFLGACSSTNDAVAPSAQPVIRGFSQDTVGPGWQVVVYGKNLAYASVWLGDVPVHTYDSTQYGTVAFTVPQNASTNYVYVSTDGSYKARSPKPLVVTGAKIGPTALIFSRASRSTATSGDAITLYGSHILQFKDSIVLLYNNLLLPVDRVYDDSLTVHLPMKAVAGAIQVIFRNQIFASFPITITRSMAWRHCSIQIIGFEYTQVRQRKGFVGNGNRKIDTTWSQHVVLDKSWYIDFTTTALVPNASAFQIAVQQYTQSPSSSSSLTLNYDTLYKTVTGYFSFGSRAETFLPAYVSDDSSVSFNFSYTVPSLNLDAADSIVIPFSVQPYLPTFSTSHTEIDHSGAYSWTEYASVSTSPRYDVGRIVLTFTP